MQNMWISVALIVAVIIVGIIAGKRLSTPGPQRRAVYFAFGTLAVLALWFFIFVAFFPAEWIVPFSDTMSLLEKHETKSLLR